VRNELPGRLVFAQWLGEPRNKNPGLRGPRVSG